MSDRRVTSSLPRPILSAGMMPLIQWSMLQICRNAPPQYVVDAHWHRVIGTAIDTGGDSQKVPQAL